MVAGGCGNVGRMSPVDGPPIDEPAVDGPTVDTESTLDASTPDVQPTGPLGSRENPARGCAELKAAVAIAASGVYWVRGPGGTSPQFEIYCEQQLNGGGWAMLENSVRRDDGLTTAFWQFDYADRLRERGTLAPDRNYYNGALYLIGKEYMDMFTDLQGTTAVAAVMSASGIDPDTMQLTMPTFVMGNADVFTRHFAAGWSANNYDGDTYADDNCANLYGSVAQHYDHCWSYNLGVDGDADANSSRLDSGVGPHVRNDVLAYLGLALQPDGGTFSQVKRIARFTRW